MASSATPIPDQTARHRRALRIWLGVVAILVFAMVGVGGATRLTDSGLSITEWKPISGAIPPLNDSQWQAEFQAYQQIPQYREMNAGMSLPEFKGIFWWEWSHRQLARLIGAVMVLPFLAFWAIGWIERALMPRLLGLMALLACEPVLGWWMVASGLQDRTEVAQERLAAHLTLACLIFSATLWALLSLRPARAIRPGPQAGALAFWLVPLILVQIFLGGLVAGLRAGYAYNTWPLMDGRLVPALSDLYIMRPAWLNHLANALTVQFQHRMTAYLILAVVVLHAMIMVRRGPGPATRRAVAVAGLAASQAVVGIVTLLLVVPIWAGLLHQAWAVVVLAMATVHAQMSASERAVGLRPAEPHGRALPA